MSIKNNTVRKLLLFYTKERVTTNGDECNHVGHKQGESPSPKYAAQNIKRKIMSLNINGTYYYNRCGPIKILRELNNDKYEIQFLNTGTIKIARKDAIKNGCVRDPYAKLNCNIACTGNIKTKGKYKPYYNVWNSMIHRCYAEQDGKYKNYNNVTVSDRWLIFENFYKDCKKIDGFNEELFLNNELVLDKDIKQRYQKHKTYSLETCTWVTKSENAKYQDGQMKQFIAIDPSGKRYIADNITQFAREHNLDRRHISGVLHGRAKTTQHWKFIFCEDIV